jgi:hypothetical protein
MESEWAAVLYEITVSNVGLLYDLHHTTPFDMLLHPEH